MVQTPSRKNARAHSKGCHPPGSAGGQPLRVVDVEVMSHAASGRENGVDKVILAAEQLGCAGILLMPGCCTLCFTPRPELLSNVTRLPPADVVRPAAASTNPQRHQGSQGLHKVAASRSRQAPQPRLHARAAGSSSPTSPRSDSNQAKSLTPPYDQPPSIALHPNSRPHPHPTHPAPLPHTLTILTNSPSSIHHHHLLHHQFHHTLHPRSRFRRKK